MNRTFLYLPVIAALFLGLLLAPAAASAQEAPGGVDKDGSWYPGEGLKHGDFFSYRMCHVNYKECAPFEMDLWVKGDVQIASETKWLVEVAVFDGSKRVVGEMHLGKVAPEPSSGASDLSEYRDAFKSSIVWLSAFATIDGSSGEKGPKEFRAISWSKIGNIGGQQVRPMAIETVTVPAGTWETVQVGWHAGGLTSKVWIVDDFPFPIKAKTFTHVSSGIATVEYEFTLLKYEENVQQSPFEDIESTVDPFAALGCDTDIEKDVGLKKSTTYFDYQIHLFYGPENPIQGCEIKWQINFLKFSDEKEFLNEVQYDIRVYDENLNQIRSIAQDEGKRVLYSPSGQALVEFTVKERPGIATYVIWVYGLAPLGIVPSDSDDFLAVEVEILENDDLFTVKSPDNTAVLGKPVDSDTAPDFSIPSWVKTNAEWWADGIIDDASFVTAISYLIEHGIIQIPPTSQDVDNDGGDGTTTNTVIPSWVKTNAGWWADGTLDDASFVTGIQYMIANGIIVLS